MDMLFAHAGHEHNDAAEYSVALQFILLGGALVVGAIIFVIWAAARRRKRKPKQIK